MLAHSTTKLSLSYYVLCLLFLTTTGLLFLPNACLPRVGAVEVHLLKAALLAAEGCVPSIHEDGAIAWQRLGVERSGISCVPVGLPKRLGVEEEGVGEPSFFALGRERVEG